MHSRHRVAAIVAACVLILSSGGVHAQAPAAASKRPLSYDVYDSWRSIQGTVLSRDGGWIAYALVPQDGDGELVVRNLRTGAERRQRRGKDPKFTADGRFVAFTVAALKDEVDKAKKAGKKDADLPKNGFGVMNVETGQVFTADRVKSFKLPDEGSGAVAYLLEPAEKKDDKAAKEQETEKEKGKKKKEKKKEPGTDLIVRQLATGESSSRANVAEYAWNKDGSLLAYAVSSTSGETDGAYVGSTKDGSVLPLLKGKGFYKNLVFDDEGTQVAFVSDRDEHAPDPYVAKFKLYHWRAGATQASEMAGASTKGMPPEFSVSEHGKIAFAKDGSAVFFGIARVPAPQPPDDATEPVKVDLWSYKDPFLQPMQKAQAEEEQKRSYLAVIHLKDKTLVPLGSPEMPEVTLTENVWTVLGASDVPYRQLVSWDGDYNDYYLVNLREGSRKRLLERRPFAARLSPGGRYVLYYDDQEHDWISVRVSDGRKANLTEKLAPRFEDEDWDTPDQPRPYGTAGWVEGDKAVLLYDRYDIWEAQPDGSAAPRLLTQGQGRAQKIVFRYQKIDPDEKAIPAGKPLLLSATDERTKASGYYRVSAGAAPQKVIMLEKAFGGFQKAKNADVFVFTLSRFEEFPNLWVSGPAFTDMKKVSDANPQQSQFVWGRTELLDYTNADGKALRAMLVKPENFDPAKKYPLMVYIYEQLTNGLHRYVAPAPGTSINVSRYVSHGYVVLMPDIVYDIGYPGQSAYKCVMPAIQKVVSMGFIDPARIGIQGHSWGGYQITYLITRTNLFRAVEAGASVSNMVSAYGGIRWGTGLSRAFQYEKTQSRIGAPPWDKTLEYIENSPIFWVEKVQTPYLTVHNDEDDAVPWYQGIEFFSAMRRLGKEAYMFVYNGEKHGLRQRDNQKHWTVHMDEFFDHYLLGAPKPQWMDTPVPYLDRGTRDVTGYYKKKTTDR